MYIKNWFWLGFRSLKLYFSLFLELRSRPCVCYARKLPVFKDLMSVNTWWKFQVSLKRKKEAIFFWNLTFCQIDTPLSYWLCYKVRATKNNNFEFWKLVKEIIENYRKEDWSHNSIWIFLETSSNLKILSKVKFYGILDSCNPLSSSKMYEYLWSLRMCWNFIRSVTYMTINIASSIELW